MFIGDVELERAYENARENLSEETPESITEQIEALVRTVREYGRSLIEQLNDK